MVMEVCCGQCNGRLLIETAGVVVACPHCGVHLSIPLPDSETDPHVDSPAADRSHEQSAASPPDPSPSQSPGNAFTDGAAHAAGISDSPAPSTAFAPDMSNVVSASSIFQASDIDGTEPNRISAVGWPSSPDLSLADSPDQIAGPEPTGGATTPGENAPTAPDFSWMGSTEKPVALSSSPEPPQFSFGSSPSPDTPAAAQVPQQIGWPGSPNLPLSERSEATPPVQEGTPPPTIPSAPTPAFPASASEVAPDFASPPATSSESNSGAPDFSWLQSSNIPPAAASPSQFSFGAPHVVNEAPEQSMSSGASSLPAQPFDEGFASTYASSHVADPPQQPASPVPSTFAPASNPTAGNGVPSPSVAPWGGFGESSPSTAFAQEHPHAQASNSGFELNSFGAAASSPQPNESGLPSLSRSNVTAPIATELSREQTASGQPLVSMALLILGSYASLVTICLLYFLFFMRKHQLESLPDLKTVQQLGGRASIPRPEHLLPAGHELKLGQSERFGNIRVTALRVTREPIAFKHFTGDAGSDRSPSDPVLKLWLKFENVSLGQTIVPLDTTLMFFSRPVEDHVASYNVIFREADRKQRKAQFYYPFDRMSAESEWTMVGQHTNESLAPGESFETYIPSEENTEGLKGDVVWRVHFRKGHGFMTGNGVTTLIDVRFNTADIKSESA